MTGITVIVSVRGPVRDLSVTLDSLLAQDMGSWDAVIVTDGGDADTINTASRYAKKDPRISLLMAERANRAALRNGGLAHATGDWLLFVDAPGRLATEHLRRLYAAVRDSPGAVGCGGSMLVTEESQGFLPRIPGGIEEAPLEALARWNGLALHSVLVPRAAVERLGGFDTTLGRCADWDLWQRLAAEGCAFVAASGAFAEVRVETEGLDVPPEAATVLRLGRDRLGRTDETAAAQVAFSLLRLEIRSRAAAAGAGQRVLPEFTHAGAVLQDRDLPLLATTLLEGLCIGAARSPASLLRDWPQTLEWVRAATSGLQDADIEALIRQFAALLGVVTDSPGPLVGVVIPAYRAADVIDETLDSVRSQSHRALDIIVVDDGSPDATADHVIAHALADARVSLLRQANGGVAMARNRGWRLCLADTVAFVDADDLWAPTKIERQLEALAAQGPAAGLAYTWYAQIDGESRITNEGHRPSHSGRVLPAILHGNFVGNGSSALITRRALEDVGGYDPTLQYRGAHGCEDFSIYFRVAETREFALVPEQLTGYRVLSNNMSSDLDRMLRSWSLVVDEVIQRHPDAVEEIGKGTSFYLEWSMLLAAGRGNVGSALSLWRRLFRRRPGRALAVACWAAPKAYARGVILRLSPSLREKRERRMPRYAIGDPAASGVGRPDHG